MTPQGLHPKPVVDNAMVESLPRAIVRGLHARDFEVTCFFRWLMEQDYDVFAYAELQKRYINREQLPQAKFFALSYYLPKKLRYLITLNWKCSPPMRVLDLGAGPGHVHLLGRYMGHEVVGIDLPGQEVFEAMRAFWRAPCVEHRIQAYKPLPQLGRFDFVTGFCAQFDRYGDAGLWEVPEWEWFIDHVMHEHLNPGGRLYIHLTSGRPDSTFKFFQARAACSYDVNRFCFVKE